MDVHIISMETIKPSSPTPNHLRMHNLSLLDQLVPPINIPVFLFYRPTSNQSSKQRSFQLKNALSHTLVHFPAFAGRLMDDFTVDCNDGGASFIEAEVDIDMDSVLKEPVMDLLSRLQPDKNIRETSDKFLVSIQVNYFGCGGLAIAACLNHVVADASVVATFLHTWADDVRGSDHVIGDDAIPLNCNPLFPLHDLSAFWKILEERKDMIIREEVITKRFLFESSKISLLRDEIGYATSPYRPTRVEAVSALIWDAMADSVAQNEPVWVATSVNLRKRMNQTFPWNCTANVSQFTMTELEMMDQKTNNIGNLARKIHDSITKVDDEHVRKLHADGAYLKIMESALEGFGKNWILSFSSWCRFPFYQTDFGWGNPIWFGTTIRLNRVAFFLDAKDEEGIEMWITLTLEDMIKLEQHHGILAYATFKPSI